MLDGNVNGSGIRGNSDLTTQAGLDAEGVASIQGAAAAEESIAVRTANAGLNSVAERRIDTRVSTDGKFSVVIADPPWSYGNKATRAAADDHYPTLPTRRFFQIPVEDWTTEDASLFLWTTDVHLLNGDALKVVEAWGFVGKQIIPWIKIGESGKVQIGMGNYFRHASELCIFATKGKVKVSRKDLPAVIMAPRGKHSEKPEGIHEIAEMSLPGPRLEMFARRARDGWIPWGNQAPGGAQ